MGYCEWAYTDPLNTTYHDNEWGVPVHDDRQMFEHLTLENLQCGLSWLIVLRKRDIFRQCFDNFDYDKVAAYGDADVERILNTEGNDSFASEDTGRHQQCLLLSETARRIRKPCDYFWSFTGGKTILYQGHAKGQIPVSNGLSERISKDLKKRALSTSAP